MRLEERIKLLSDVAVIKTKVTIMADNHKIMKSSISKNTRFRIMITGFIIISIPIVGLAVSLFKE